MTENLKKAIAFTRSLSAEQQDDVARLMMFFVGGEPDDGIVELTADEEAALRIGIEQADRGQFATDEEVRSTFAKYER